MGKILEMGSWWGLGSWQTRKRQIGNTPFKIATCLFAK